MSTKRKKIHKMPVPAKMYDRALSFVNKRREQNGLSRLDALPAGIPRNVRSCPCASQCGKDKKGRIVEVGYKTWDLVDIDNLMNSKFNLSGAPLSFTTYFDKAADEMGWKKKRILPVRVEV